MNPRKPLLICILAAILVPSLVLRASGQQDRAPEPKEAIARQIQLVMDGEINALRNSFTPRLRGEINMMTLMDARDALEGVNLDDLVDKVVIQQHDGKKTAELTMKNGRKLTTLIWEKNVWLADTIWWE